MELHCGSAHTDGNCTTVLGADLPEYEIYFVSRSARSYFGWADQILALIHNTPGKTKIRGKAAALKGLLPTFLYWHWGGTLVADAITKRPRTRLTRSTDLFLSSAAAAAVAVEVRWRRPRNSIPIHLKELVMITVINISTSAKTRRALWSSHEENTKDR